MLVFDEPTSGLDLTGMCRVAELIRRVAEAGNVVFVATHDLEFICHACSRVLHLAGGRLATDLRLGPGLAPQVAALLADETSWPSRPTSGPKADDVTAASKS